MTFTLRPISDWSPFGEGFYKNSPFRVTYREALELLERELDFLDATDVAVELAISEADIRNDGQLRASARPSSPAVRLAFESKQGPLIYATDEFEKPSWRSKGMQASWQHNLYAIALGLEALRKLDRYGITRHGEQYTGWKALPAGRAMPASHMTRVDAIVLLADLHDPESLARSVKRARYKAHPDRNAGDRTLWDQVEQAGAVLGVTR